MIETRLAFGGLDRLHNGFHVQRPFCRFIIVRHFRTRGPVFPAFRMTQPYKGQSKIGLNNTIKIRFICNGERFVECAI